MFGIRKPLERVNGASVREDGGYRGKEREKQGIREKDRETERQRGETLCSMFPACIISRVGDISVP